MQKNMLSAAICATFLSGMQYTIANEMQKPNILLIVADDLGYSDISPFGGEIPTPNIQALADEGIRFSEYYTSPMSAPARSMIMTGNTNQEAGVGAMWLYESTEKKPGYELKLTDRVKTMPEVFHENGYNTLMAGKWHIGSDEGASPKERGFQKSFAIMGGGASHFNDIVPLGRAEMHHTFYTDNGTELRTLPEDFYSTTHYTNLMKQWITETPQDQPIFAYLAYTAPHDPIQAPNDWIEKFSSQYKEGYQPIYDERMKNLVDMDYISRDINIPSLDFQKKWNLLSPEQQAYEAKKMQVYAAMISYMDNQIGTVIETLKATDRYDNTIILFLSDNGANPSGREKYDIEDYWINIQKVDDSFQNLGKIGSFVSVGENWGDVNNAPYQILHKTTTAQGGINANFIMKAPMLPNESIGELNRNYIAAYDLAPTLYELANISVQQTPTKKEMFGVSHASQLKGESNVPARDSLGIELHNQAAYIEGDWKIRRVSKTIPEGKIAQWELFNIKKDPLETDNLAESEKSKLEELAKKYQDFAEETMVIESSGHWIPYKSR